MAKNDKDESAETEAAKAKADAEAFAQLEAEEAAMAKPPEAPSVAEGLVKMSKGGETLDVHPAAVEDHITVGWELV